MKAKPCPIGKKFGKLLILAIGDRVFEATKNPKYKSGKTSKQRYVCRCECGRVVQRKRNQFDHPSRKNPSCGCGNIAASRRNGKPKPDCSGQKFGSLTVIKKTDISCKRGNGTSHLLWELQCDCGEIVYLARGCFDRAGGKGQKSCGCKRRERITALGKANAIDIKGQRFGELVAISLTGNQLGKRPEWLMQCDCGNVRKLSLTRLRSLERQGSRINCADKDIHPQTWYPHTPSPYPKEAGNLLVKYLHLCRTNLKKHHAEIEDKKRDRLIRACWILTYRRQQGEQLSESYERNYLLKHLAYASVDIFWKNKVENEGGVLYTVNGKKKQIGRQMTDVTLHDYPVSESGTLGNTFLSTEPIKRKKFQRC